MINPKYVVKKVLNNNVVSASYGFNEVVVTGLGIGFNAKPKDVIDESKIEKIFELRKEDYYKMIELAKELDEDVFSASYNLIHQIDNKYGFQLDAHAYMVMIDHINFAIERHKTNQNIHNFLVTEMKILYPQETSAAAEMVELINSTMKVDLPYDEVGFLVLHIVNGSDKTIKQEVSLLTDCVLESMNVIRDYYLISLKAEELNTQRMMVHLKMLITRLINGQQVNFGEVILSDVFQKFEKAYSCAKLIQEKLEKRLKAKINQQEIVYLTIHLNRLEQVVS